MTALWIVLGIVTLIIILFLIHIKVQIKFSYSENGNNAEVKIHYLFYNVTLYPSDEKKKKEGKKEGKKSKKGSLLDDFKFFADIYDDIKKIAGRFFSYLIKHAITVHEFNVSAEIGMKDAMQTGIIVGTSNAFLYTLIGTMQKNMKLKDWNINVFGNFEEKRLKIGVYCVIGTNIMHFFIMSGIIFRILPKILLSWRKNKNGKSSYRDA